MGKMYICQAQLHKFYNSDYIVYISLQKLRPIFLSPLI